MCTKRTWKGKYIFLYIACLMGILFGMQGCSNLNIWQTKQKLTKATNLMVKGDYERSLEYNKEALRLLPRMFGEQALFQMGLNYAHPENPDSNYQKSIESFQSIIVEYPKSKLRNQAAIWIMLLRKIEENDKRVKNMIKKKDKMIENLENQIKKLKEIDLGIEEKKRKSLPDE